MAASTLHLGQKARAWRAMLNWRRSWLSREVLAFSAFLGLAGLALVAVPFRPALGLIAAAFGFGCLACVDRVYAAMARERRTRLDDVAAVASASFLAGALAGSAVVFVPAGAVRVVGAVMRTRARDATTPASAWRLAGPRIAVGLALPLALWLAAPASLAPAAVVCCLVGELLDRCDFYDALEVVTPARRMARDLASGLESRRTNRLLRLAAGDWPL